MAVSGAYGRSLERESEEGEERAARGTGGEGLERLCGAFRRAEASRWKQELARAATTRLVYWRGEEDDRGAAVVGWAT